jgi:hypothetical protein
MPFERANLKVVIIDHLTDGWGFVSVSSMNLTRAGGKRAEAKEPVRPGILPTQPGLSGISPPPLNEPPLGE